MNDKDLKPPFVANIDNFAGKAVHAALYKLFDISETPINERLLKETLKSKLEAGWNMVEKNKKEYFTEKERLSLFGSKEGENAYKQKFLQILIMYMANTEDISSLVPFMLEDWVDCTLGEFQIGSRIDRVDTVEDSKVRVVDYKTGKLPYRTEMKEIIKEDYQMPFNAIIMFRRFPNTKKIRCELHYISSNSVFSADWTSQEIREMESILLSNLAEIKNAKDFAPRKNPLCDWCEFKNICPLFKQKEVKNV